MHLRVEPRLFRNGQCPVDLENAELAPIGTDDADRADPDLPVDARALPFVGNKSLPVWR